MRTRKNTSPESAGTAALSDTSSGMGNELQEKPKMQWTIKKRLSGLTIGGLIFVAAVSATRDWGITGNGKNPTQRAGTAIANCEHNPTRTFNGQYRGEYFSILPHKGGD